MILLSPPEPPAAPALRTSLRGSPWRTGLVPQIFRRAFADPPSEEIWEWADENVWLANEDAAEPGPYRSAKTTWTRRLQELFRHPYRYCYDRAAKQWVPVRISKIIVQKSSQSGFSEACFNGIRWRATFRPRNVIFAIDSEAEAKKVARRVLRSLQLPTSPSSPATRIT